MSIVSNGYRLIDVAKANVPDCFVFNTNKIGRGAGEAKFYIGGTSLKNWTSFFDDFSIPCFFTKGDLIDYMDTARTEYDNQSQGYNNDIGPLWQLRMDDISKLPVDIFFTIFRKVETDRLRFYIQSNDDIWTMFRKLALPIMTSLIVQKIEIAGAHYLWFRPYINEIGIENDVIRDLIDKEIEKVEQDRTITETTRLQLTKARVGQGAFRENVISKFNGQCIVTQINDERVLVASHIKPWVVSANAEKLDKENGLLFTPTFDKLFDKGFISFRDSGEIILSDHFAERNYKILNLKAKDKFDIKATPQMKVYLDYHREQVFRK